MVDLRTSSWNSDLSEDPQRVDLIFSCWLCVCSACVVCLFCGQDTRSVSGSKKIPRGPKGRFWAAARARRGTAEEAVGPHSRQGRGHRTGLSRGPLRASLPPCL
jgi:hypothetical protein